MSSCGTTSAFDVNSEQLDNRKASHTVRKEKMRDAPARSALAVVGGTALALAKKDDANVSGLVTSDAVALAAVVTADTVELTPFCSASIVVPCSSGVSRGELELKSGPKRARLASAAAAYRKGSPNAICAASSTRGKAANLSCDDLVRAAVTSNDGEPEGQDGGQVNDWRPVPCS